MFLLEMEYLSEYEKYSHFLKQKDMHLSAKVITIFHF